MPGNNLSTYSFTDIYISDRHIWPDRVRPRDANWCVRKMYVVGALISPPALWAVVGGGGVHPLTGRTSWLGLLRGDKHLIGQHTVRLSPIT